MTQIMIGAGFPAMTPTPTKVASPELIQAHERLQSVRSELRQIKSKFDAAQTFSGNENHWAQSDKLDPHSTASYTVRSKLRSRSRYEANENNPYLKGTFLTLCNDFVGTGPKIKITDDRISKELRVILAKKFNSWFKSIKGRKKLWRLRMAKLVDGEAFARSYTNFRTTHPVKLDYNVVEADVVSSEAGNGAILNDPQRTRRNEIDGIRFDQFLNPTMYHFLRYHPGSANQLIRIHTLSDKKIGDWVDERFVIHWFRQDRGWLRGIPEITPSLPLCALLRRYTLAVVRHKEVAADFSAVLETQGSGNTSAWTDGQGNLLDDDPFDLFPIDMGMITTMPRGYKMNQLNPVPDGIQYDEFVSSLLREITRPVLTPYNVASGTSADSNMATSVVDLHLYKGGQAAERLDCEEVVLDRMFLDWFTEARLIPGYLPEAIAQDPQYLNAPVEHSYRWDSIGLEHTDPSKVADSINSLNAAGHLTDEDIQEKYFNRPVEEWREEVKEMMEFRKEVGLIQEPEPAEGSSGEQGSQVSPKKRQRDRAKSEATND